MRPPPAIILAGGQARRMGGGDKALLPLGAGCVLDTILARLAPQAGPLALNANGDPARFARFGLPVLPDTVADFPGPLAGVLAGMDWAAGLGADFVVSVAGDTPFFPGDLVPRLLLAAEEAPIALAATDGLHPTFGLWPTALREDLRAALKGGTRKVLAFTDRHGMAEARWPVTDPDPFFNINTPEDLARAQAWVAG
ncbi:MAG: molybdenum cofactor guanylyltransferase MobA [Shimia sp.]